MNNVTWGDISLFQPFIDPNYKKIDKNILKKNELYHQLTYKDYIIGYFFKDNNIPYRRINFFFNFYLYNNLNKYELNYLKIKIKKEDLVLINRIKKYEFIRQVKYV